MIWATAFAITQAIELPFYLTAAPRDWSWKKRLAVGFGASAITHPFVWFFFPDATRWLIEVGGLDLSYRVPYWILAETFAVTVEALWLRRWGLRDPLLWALLANGCSAGCGFLIHAARHLG